MTWNPDENVAVGNAILGSWPGTITQWGKEAFAAYIGELQARGLTAEQVLVAVRTWSAGSDFPPSAPNLAAAARKDPSKPIGAEVVRIVRWVLAARIADKRSIWLGDERRRADERAQLDRAGECHPLVAAFIRSQGLDRLRRLDLDGEWAEANRKRLIDEFDRFTEAHEGREVVALVAGSGRDGLAQLDPLASISGARRPQLKAVTGSEAE